jgi:hypothetical protein
MFGRRGFWRIVLVAAPAFLLGALGRWVWKIMGPKPPGSPQLPTTIVTPVKKNAIVRFGAWLKGEYGEVYKFAIGIILAFITINISFQISSIPIPVPEFLYRSRFDPTKFGNAVIIKPKEITDHFHLEDVAIVTIEDVKDENAEQLLSFPNAVLYIKQSELDSMQKAVNDGTSCRRLRRHHDKEGCPYPPEIMDRIYGRIMNGQAVVIDDVTPSWWHLVEPFIFWRSKV